jgi:hypothetical protein
MATFTGGATPNNQRKRKYDYFTRAAKNRSTDLDEELTDAQLVSTVMNYSIDPYDYNDEQLFKMALIIFRYYDLPNEFGFHEATLCHFMCIVRDMYEAENYFHNFKHAWGVMHMCFHILKRGGERYVDRLDVFTILIAALCHDARHPGNSNAFEMATESHVSKKFSKVNEVCVLERLHAFVTASILMTEDDVGYNLLSTLGQSERERFVQQVDYIILGTDMGKHVTLVNEAKAFLSQGDFSEILPLNCNSNSSNVSADSQESSVRQSPRLRRNRKTPYASTDEHDYELSQESKSPRSPRNPSLLVATHVATNFITSNEARASFTRVLVHSADIGAQTQCRPVALKWVDRVYSEYRDQAERERNLGIMTSPFLHDLKDDAKVYSTQYSFINDVVEPIWAALTTLIPDLKFALDQLIDNKLHYKSLF